MLDTKIKELSRSGSIDGIPVENQKAVDMLIIDLNKMKSNQYLFRQEHKANYIAQHSVNKKTMDETVQNLLDASLEAGDGIYMETLGGLSQGKEVLTAEGVKLMADYNLKSTQMYSELLQSVSHIKDDEERRIAYVEKERNELFPAMKEWLEKTTNSATVVTAHAKTQRVKENEEIVGPEEVARIMSEHGPSIGPRVIEHLAEQQRQEATDKTLTRDMGGKLVLEGTFNSTKLDNFEAVLKLDNLNPEETISVFNDAHEAAWGNATFQLGFAGKINNPSEIEKLAFKMMIKKLPRD